MNDAMVTQAEKRRCRVAVCMSTYNGAKYLKDQIDSILAQEGEHEITLFVRDDMSSDHTRSLLKEYSKKHRNIVFVNPDEYKNVGVKESFLGLLKQIVDTYSGYDYFSLADQDDYWKKDKIQTAVDMLEQITDENTEGKIYYSNKTIVDSELNLIREERIAYTGSIMEMAFTGLAFGCTMVFDRRFAKLITKHIPRCKCWHDAWIYRLAKTLNVEVAFDDASYILYRQHDSNVVGIAKEKSLAKLGAEAIKAVFSKREHVVQSQLSEIAEHYSDELSRSRYNDFVMNIVNYNKNLRSKMWLLRYPPSKELGAKTRLMWIYKVIFHLV